MNWKTILNEHRLTPTTREKKTFDLRNEFESDYGRIIFSPAIRRMHDKTQVFPLQTDDNIHTRLTHSMEVQSVAYSIGLNICNNPEFVSRTGFTSDELIRIIPLILSSISLCHDIGNPPFGHFGEDVISNYFKGYFKNNSNYKLTTKEQKDFTEYNGNAQGFRILSKTQLLQEPFGLNLTIGNLAAYLKYPFMSDELTGKAFGRKIGVFQSEREYLLTIREKTQLKKIRHPLTFLMEAADNICYNIMDMEDGFNLGYYCYKDISNFLLKNGDDIVRRIINDFENKNIKEIESKGINIERTKVVKLRIRLIQELVDNTCQNFINKIEDIEAGNYNNELISEENNSLINILNKFSVQQIFKQRDVQSLELTGESVIKGLLDQFVPDFLNYRDIKYENKKRTEKLFGLVSRTLRELVILEYGDLKLYQIPDYGKLRLIVDYISGMTDNFALNLYRKLRGIKI